MVGEVGLVFCCFILTLEAPSASPLVQHNLRMEFPPLVRKVLISSLVLADGDAYTGGAFGVYSRRKTPNG